MVLLEQIQTVNKSSLTDYIGFVEDERIWKQINAAIKQTFGLWFYSCRERAIFAAFAVNA